MIHLLDPRLRERVGCLACLLAALIPFVLTPSAWGQATTPLDSQTFLDEQLHANPPLSGDLIRRVRELVGQMTLQEKVGQMTQLEIGMVTDGRDADLRINPAKLR